MQIAANVNGTWQNRSFTYYIGQSFTNGFTSPYNFMSIFAGLLSGLGATGAFVFFLLILLAITVLIWRCKAVCKALADIICEASVLPCPVDICGYLH